MRIPEYENYQENKQHGKISFPFDTYLCTIPQDFLNVPLHWHEEMEIIYVKKGNGLVSVDLQDFSVKEGDIILVLPGRLHGIRTEKWARMEYENIIFSPELLYSRHMDICTADFLQPLFSGKLSLPVCFRKESDHYPEIASVLDTCDQAGEEKPEGRELLIKSQLFQLFFILKNRCLLDDTEPAISKNLERMKPVLKYMELHYGESMSIEQIAGIAACAPSYFMRIFKSVFGLSFIEYLNDYRLTMSARLLTETNRTILDIASGVGFDNLSYFSRSFKKKYGMTPGSYRKRGLNKAAEM